MTLFLILHIFIGSTLAGMGVIVALTMGFVSAQAILLTAAVGFVAAFPVSWVVAKRLAAGRAQ